MSEGGQKLGKKLKEGATAVKQRAMAAASTTRRLASQGISRVKSSAAAAFAKFKTAAQGETTKLILKVCAAALSLSVFWTTWAFLNRNNNAFTDNGYKLSTKDGKDGIAPYNETITPIMFFGALGLSLYYANMIRAYFDADNRFTNIIIGFLIIFTNILLLFSGYTLIVNQGKIGGNDTNEAIKKTPANDDFWNYLIGSFDITIGAAGLILTFMYGRELYKEGTLYKKKTLMSNLEVS